MEVGWAVIGCSDIVEKRAGAAIQNQRQSRIVAFHSRDAERAQAFAEDFDAEYGTNDLERVLGDDRVAVAYVATEVDRHRELTVAALNAGKHVLVEKPMALDVAECRQMIDAAEASGCHLAAAYYARFVEKSRVMKRVIYEGRLGKIVRCVVRNIGYCNPERDSPKYWRVTHRAGGNNLADVGSHRLDLLCYFMGGRPVKVMGLADRLEMDYEACDTETALVQFDNGAHVVAMANANVPHPGKWPTSVEVHGTKGSLVTDPWSSDPVVVVGSDDEAIEIAVPENRHAPMIDDFAAAIAEGRAPRFNGTDGMWATAIVAGAYESAATGQAIAIQDC